MRYGFWVVALIVAFALQYRTEIRDWIHPPAPITVPAGFQAVIYGTSWCPYCAKARAFFRKNHVPFRDYDIEKSDVARAQYDRLGGNGIPLILIGDKVIDGYDEDAMRSALATIKPSSASPGRLHPPASTQPSQDSAKAAGTTH